MRRAPTAQRGRTARKSFDRNKDNLSEGGVAAPIFILRTHSNHTSNHAGYGHYVTPICNYIVRTLSLQTIKFKDIYG
jgi:hypothetical protein